MGGAIVFLVIGASILGVNALHTLMRRGQAARVASLVYLTPIFAVALEFLIFGVVPTGVSALGIAITMAGVALVVWRRETKRPVTAPAAPAVLTKTVRTT
jgi:drug/metabolite transporter (DMT)-like permease